MDSHLLQSEELMRPNIGCFYFSNQTAFTGENELSKSRGQPQRVLLVHFLHLINSWSGKGHRNRNFAVCMTILMSGVTVFFHLLKKPEGLLLDVLLGLSRNIRTLGWKLQEGRRRDCSITGCWQRPQQDLSAFICSTSTHSPHVTTSSLFLHPCSFLSPPVVSVLVYNKQEHGSRGP